MNIIILYYNYLYYKLCAVTTLEKLMEQKKKINLTIQQRLEILEQLGKNVPMIILAEKYGVSKATISRIKSTKNDILSMKRTLTECDGSLKKKKFTGIEDSALDKTLYKWFVQRRSIGTPISGTLLQEQARKFNILLNGSENFKASDGWLEKFKQRHSIRHVTVHGEKLSADSDASEDFKIKLNNIITLSGISLDNIYNCDETGLNWQLLPNNTLVTKEERNASSRKKSKSRITVMVCTNASGTHKLPLYIIGKSEKPRCFKNVKNLPVIYRKQKSAWMDSTLMEDWYDSVFLPEIKKKASPSANSEQKFILIMDNAPCHLSEEKFNSKSDLCTVLFLPPNVTSLIQPMDQGVIEKFKRLYKKLFVQTLLPGETREEVDKIIKSYNLLNCCNFCAMAWNSVTERDIRNCWKKLIPINNTEDGNSEVDNLNNSALQPLLNVLIQTNIIRHEEINEWFQSDSEDCGWQIATDEELAAEYLQDPPVILSEEICDNDSNNDNSFAKVPLHQAYEAVNTLINHYENNEKHEVFLPILTEISNDITKQLLNNEE